MKKIVFCPSIKEANRWYIFRENGVEITVELVGDKFKSSKQLRQKEIEFLNKKLR